MKADKIGGEIDYTVLVTRDYQQVREDFLASIENDKIFELIDSLEEKPYYLPQMFPKIAGWGAKKQVKQTVDLVKKVEPLLDDLLLDGEEVRFVTFGVYSSIAEQYFLGGLVAYYLNQTVFVLTNYRIIMLNCDSKKRPHHMKWHIPYDQIKKFSTGWISSSVTLKLKDKTSLCFASVFSKDRTPMREFVSSMMQQVEKEDFHMPCQSSQENLCPTCYQPVAKKTYECKKCGDTFIHPKKPALMSLFVPCLGDFYVGHRFFAVLELVGLVVAWICAITFSIEKKNWGFAVIIILLYHLFDAGITYHMTGKGLVSTKHIWGKKS